MCLIIHSPPGHVPALKDIASALKQNDDGVGLMHYAGTKPVVFKALSATAKQVHERMQTLEDFDKVVHFRMATHGRRDDSNLHPFRLADGGFLMHNGIISIDRSKDTNRSDTWHFIDQEINPALVQGTLDWQKVAEDIGPSNRLVTLQPDGDIIIVNKSAGVEHDGAWFSNTYAWDNDYSYHNSYYDRDDYGWDKQTTSDDLTYSVLDGLHEALIAGYVAHPEIDPVYMTSNEVYSALEDLTMMELTDLLNVYFKITRGSFYIDPMH
jgi:predicted glutamine amidotransferase